MRVLLFTGKGGVGKTTAAAATATLAAIRGHRTLVLSTDAAHSLADAFGVAAGRQPTQVADRLFVQQVDTQHRFERSWGDIQSYLISVLDAIGIDPIAAEELMVLPGAEEVLALLEVREQAASGEWDIVVVDCAPTAETLRLLALPEALGWYLRKVVPRDRRVVRALRPMLGQVTRLPMPRDRVFDEIGRLHAELAQVHTLLTGRTTSVRLVLTPERVVVAEARRALTSLSLYGYRVDGVVANRIFPAARADPWREKWVAAQAEVMSEVEASFGSLELWRSPYRTSEPVGQPELRAFAAELYGDSDPFRAAGGGPPFVVRRVSDSGFELRVGLPFAERGDVGVTRRGEEIVVTVSGHRRVIALPAALRDAAVRSAAIRDGALVVDFDAPASTPTPAAAAAPAATAAAATSTAARRVGA